MTDLTPVPEEVIEETPLSEDTPQLSEEGTIPKEETTETVESLKEKLAAETEAKEKAEGEASTWEGRVKEENPPKKKQETDKDYSDWRIDARDRLAVTGVKEAYESECSELESSGAKLTTVMREKALLLAEKSVGVKTETTETEPLPQGSVDRGGQKEPEMTATDKDFGVKAATKKKWAHMEKEW